MEFGWLKPPQRALSMESTGWFDELYTEAGTTGASSTPQAKVSHRRASSDTLAFLQPPTSSSIGEQQEQQKLDEGLRRSSSALVASLLDHQDDNNNNNQEKNVDSAAASDSTSGDGAATAATLNEDDFGSIDPTLDPKRARRIIANRQSAQRSRIRKLQYIAELEKNVNALQMEVSTLTPQVSFLDHQRVLLNVDNSIMKQRIAALVHNVRMKDAHNEALKKEVEVLRQMYYQQQQLNSIPEQGLPELEFHTNIPIFQARIADKQHSRSDDEQCQSSFNVIESATPLSLSLKF